MRAWEGTHGVPGGLRSDGEVDFPQPYKIAPWGDGNLERLGVRPRDTQSVTA